MNITVDKQTLLLTYRTSANDQLILLSNKNPALADVWAGNVVPRIAIHWLVSFEAVGQ